MASNRSHPVKRAFGTARVSEVSLESLCAFSNRTGTLVTVDAPLYGSFQVLEGKLLGRRPGARAGNNGHRPRLPSPEDILRNASRFWIQDHVGIRDRKSRREMAELLSNG